MLFKRIISLLLALFLLFNLTACEIKYETDENDNSKSSSNSSDNQSSSNDETSSSEDDQDPSLITPLLYKVTDEDGNVAWLFGSIHVGKEEFYPLPSYVLDAFNSSDALAVECDVVEAENDLALQYELFSMMIYWDGTTIKDHIPNELYENCVDILTELGYYNSELDYYIPSMWAQFIDSALYEKCGANSELGIDLHLMEQASIFDKELLEIESVKMQYQMLADYSEKLQIYLLQSSVEYYLSDYDLTAELNNLMDMWADGDETKLSEYLLDDTSDFTAEELELYNEYNDAMNVNRNKNMADFAEEALDSGDEVFICVGAAHVIGEGGIAQILENRGYTVEIIK